MAATNIGMSALGTELRDLRAGIGDDAVGPVVLSEEYFTNGETRRMALSQIPTGDALGSNPEDSVRFLQHLRRAEGDRTYGAWAGAELLALAVMEARE